MDDILFELLDCDERKERKKLVKKGLELLKAAASAPAPVEQVEEKPNKKHKKEEEPVVVVEEVKKEKKSKKSFKQEVVEEEEKKSKKSTKQEVIEEEEKKSKKDKKQKRTLEEATETDHTPVAEDTSYVADESYVEDVVVEKKRFSRIKDEAKSFQEALIQDNTYDAVFAGTGYGAKANDKLKTVRGKDFRHEKTKKKRGSYRGGAIDDEVVNSVEFSD